MITSQHAGQVITFYSFKGGTGRSMALANLAVLLAKNLTGQQRVLMMDWDLEAPGLHRFFQDQLRPVTDKGRDATQVVDERLGLIDLFLELDSSLRGSSCREEDRASAVIADKSRPLHSADKGAGSPLAQSRSLRFLLYLKSQQLPVGCVLRKNPLVKSRPSRTT